MDQSSYSEKELGFDFCNFKLSLKDETINKKLAALPVVEERDKTEKDKLWAGLFSRLVKNHPNTKSDDVKCNEPIKMDVSHDISMDITDEAEILTSEQKTSYEEYVTLVVEKCHEMSTKLKSAVENVTIPLVEDLNNLKESDLQTVMTSAWAGLNGDNAKMAFCILFTSNPKLCKALCVHVLLPWMTERVPNKLEELSKILSKEGEIVCQYLIAPLLQTEGCPLVKDSLSLEELLSAMSRKQCSTLLRVLIDDGFELQLWNLPFLALVLDNSNPTNEDLQKIINLASSVGTMFAQSRDFGLLLVSISNALKPGSDNIVSQMDAVVNSYKGSLKFKALKILSDLKD